MQCLNCGKEIYSHSDHQDRDCINFLNQKMEWIITRLDDLEADMRRIAPRVEELIHKDTFRDNYDY